MNFTFTFILITLSTLVSRGQINNFLTNDLICLDDDTMSVVEAAILKNDNFDKKNFLIELDPSSLPKYGTAEIIKVNPSLLPTFFGTVYYDTVTIKYSYHQSSFKKDSVRYIITDYNQDMTKDSAWLVFDIGCASKSSPNRMTCIPDQIVYTNPNSCSYDFTATEPKYVSPPMNRASFEMQLNETRSLSVGKHDRISVFSAQFFDGTVDVCETYLEVRDIEKPTIYCPQNIFSCDSIIYYPTPTAMDNCTSVSLSRLSGLASGSVFPKGKSTVTYKATDFNGSTNTCSFTVEVSNVSKISWIDERTDTLCSNHSAINLKDSLNIQSSGFWSLNAPDGIFNPALNLPNSKHTVSFIINQNNCIKTIKKDFYILPAKQANFSPFPTEICSFYGDIDLKNYENNSISGKWLLDNIEIQNLMVTKNIEVGEHKLTFMPSENYCTEAHSQLFKITQTPLIDSLYVEVCSNEYRMKLNSGIDKILTISPSLEYNVINDSLNLFSLEAKNKEITYLDLDNFKCSSINNIQIDFYQKPTISKSQDTIFLNFDENEFSLLANNAIVGKGEWIYDKNIFSLEDAFSSSTSGNLINGTSERLIWKISNGPCEASLDTQWVKKRELKVPNAFSPNEDGKNDFFIFSGVQDYMNVEFEVLNRWGQVVYNNPNYKNDWSGRDTKGELLPNDTYYFYAKINENEPIKGKITLKR